MDLRQLEYFCAISKFGNFTKTAEYLHVSQPSVTKAIKSLENEFDLILVDRRQKHVSLTPEGRVFLLHAEKILAAVEETQRDMKRFQLERQGTIHFGIPPMVEAYLFPDLFTKFKSVYPNMNLDVKEYSDSMEVREKAESGVLDCGIVFSQQGGQMPNEFLILSDNMSLCVSPDRNLAKLDNITFDDLRSENFIMQQSNTYQYQNVYERCVDSGYAPNILLCTTQMKTIKQLVTNNMGISILPDFVTRNDTSFVRKKLNPQLKVDICLFWSANKRFNEMDQSFLDFIQSYITSEEFHNDFQNE